MVNDSTNSLFKLRSISNPKKELGDTFNKLRELPWVFDKTVEKILLILLLAWTFYSVYKIFWVCGW